MGDNILKDRSYNFALRVIKIYKQIVSEKKEFVLSKQFLDAGTSIGALIREAEFAQSKADFISKLNISLKESNETDYWICLLRDSEFISKETANELSIFFFSLFIFHFSFFTILSSPKNQDYEKNLTDHNHIAPAGFLYQPERTRLL